MTDPDPTWRPDRAHNGLGARPPARELESRAVLKACIEARAALAELKQAAELIPNQAMLINTPPGNPWLADIARRKTDLPTGVRIVRFSEADDETGAEASGTEAPEAPKRRK